MRLVIFSCMFIFSYSHSAEGQYRHVDVFPDLNSNALFDSLVHHYKPAFTMSYGTARDTLYAKIDNLSNNRLECIYTGYTISLDPTVDPTQDAFSKGMNAEHSYPQSKGAGNEPARSDLHHLYPSEVTVNSDRSSYIYGDSPDPETDFWYINNVKSQGIPNENIDGYSELNLGLDPFFEPREASKGNIARSIFYFYTMYRSEAEAADPLFFDRQKSVLCAWHFQDVVDSVEWERTHKIAAYQDGKVNPFVLDCSLAARMYCPEISDACEALLTVAAETDYRNIYLNGPYPNPAPKGQLIHFKTSSLWSEEFRLRILDLTGKVMYESTNWSAVDETIEHRLNANLTRGVYVFEVTTKTGLRAAKKLIVY